MIPSRRAAAFPARSTAFALAATLVLVPLASGSGRAETAAPASPAQTPSKGAPAQAKGAPAQQQPSPPGLVSSSKPLLGKPETLHLSASLAGDRNPIRKGLTWRVFADEPDVDGARQVARSNDPQPTFSLPPGNYTVHAAYGFASATKHVSIGATDTTERLVINAGALRIAGAIGDTPIPPSKLTFAIYVPVNQNPEGRLVVANARASDPILLPEGTYHVVSTYGDSNAIMRADLKIDAGKVTEATLNYRAATVTLKLVRQQGGEAFAGTAFSVLTPGGDVIREAIGAFPSFVLAEGDYVVIARHEGQVYTREFKVASGLDKDIEVLAQ